MVPYSYENFARDAKNGISGNPIWCITNVFDLPEVTLVTLESKEQVREVVVSLRRLVHSVAGGHLKVSNPSMLKGLPYWYKE